MSTLELIQNEITHHEQLLNEIEQKPLWYRNSTLGRELKGRYEYTLDVLESLEHLSNIPTERARV